MIKSSYQLIKFLRQHSFQSSRIYHKITMNHNFYISTHLRNSESRKKNDRRISSIMNEIRFMSQEDQEEDENYDISKNWNRKLDEIDTLNKEFKGVRDRKNRRNGSYNGFGLWTRDKKERKEKKFSFGNLETIVDDQGVKSTSKKNKVLKISAFRDQSQKSSKKSLDRIPNPRQKRHHTSNSTSTPKPQTFKHWKTPRPFFSYLTFKPSKRIFKKAPTPPTTPPLLNPQLEVPHLQSENIHKLNQFIKGGYDSQLNQFTDMINLSEIDRYRKNYYIYERIYDEMVQNNIQNKMVLKDCQKQCFRDVVFLNQMKLHATAPEFKTALTQLRIIR